MTTVLLLLDACHIPSNCSRNSHSWTGWKDSKMYRSVRSWPFYKSVKTQQYPVNVSTDSLSLCPAYAAQRWKDLPYGSLQTTLANCFSSEHCYIIHILLLPTPPLLHISSWLLLAHTSCPFSFLSFHHSSSFYSPPPPLSPHLILSLAGSGDPRSNWKGTSKTQGEHWDWNWTIIMNEIIHVQCEQTLPRWHGIKRWHQLIIVQNTMLLGYYIFP